MPSQIPEKLLDFPEVQFRTGKMSKATIWRLRRAHTFPDPIAISPRRKAWLESDITAWIASRTAEAA
jgi:prophage regulatory protein